MKYKVFCLVCEWTTTTLIEKTLWSRYSKCPECLSATDALLIKKN